MPKLFGACWRGLLVIGAVAVACPGLARPDPGETLLAKHSSLGAALRQNQFKRPLVLDSAETLHGWQGDVYAIVDYPFTEVSTGLNNPGHWCDVMLLHINTKYCHAVVEPAATTLIVNVGKKTPEELAQAVRFEFNYNVALANPTYFKIILDAKDGPLHTSDYRIMLEAVALPNAKTFLHLDYSYSMNFIGRFAVQSYLVTIGREKVGFTEIGQQANGQPLYIAGVRGLMERNIMRYYLAIDAFLGAAAEPPAVQLEERLQRWFSAVEGYPQQLHEMSLGKYVEMKRAENLRQQTLY